MCIRDRPYTVLVEVAAAVKRRTNSQRLAKRVKELLQNIDTLDFVELGTIRADAATDMAINTGLRGMDAIVVQVAAEFGATLVSLDEEMIEKARAIINVRSVEEF